MRTIAKYKTKKEETKAKKRNAKIFQPQRQDQ